MNVNAQTHMQTYQSTKQHSIMMMNSFQNEYSNVSKQTKWKEQLNNYMQGI